MSWFQDALLWPRLLASSDGRDKLKNDIRNGEGVASVGSPLHGLTAGYKLHELMSPTVHMNDRIQDIRSNGLDGHFSRARDDMHHYAQDAFKENIPALVGWLGGAAAGVGEGGGLLGGGAAGSGGGAATSGSGGASGALNGGAGNSMIDYGMTDAIEGIQAPTLNYSSGTNWAGLGKEGMGLLGQVASRSEQQQAGAAPIASQPDRRNNQALQQQVAVQKRLQYLRQKPRKTSAEQQEMQELMRSGGLLSA